MRIEWFEYSERPENLADIWATDGRDTVWIATISREAVEEWIDRHSNRVGDSL